MPQHPPISPLPNVPLRAIGPYLDARTLAALLTVSTGVWGDRTSAAAGSSVVSSLSVDQWKRLAASLGAARLLRVLRALRDAVGFSTLHELNSAPLKRGIPPHVSATLWLMSLCVRVPVKSFQEGPTPSRLPSTSTCCRANTFMGADAGDSTLAIAYRTVEALSVVVSTSRDRLDAGAEHSVASSWLRCQDVPVAQVRSPIPSG